MKKISIKNLKLVVILSLFLIFVLACLFYYEEIQRFGMMAVEKFGLMGLFGVTMLLDSIIQPISPLFFTFGYTFSKSPLLVTTIVGGIASVLAGFVGYGIGSFLLNEEKIHCYIGAEKCKKMHRLFEKYGFWAVFIGVNIGFPFAPLCWSAGIFRMPFYYFGASIILARIPRFILIGYLGTLVV